MLFTPAYAQSGAGGGADLFSLLFPFALIFIIMYFLVIRPQQKRLKEHREMLGALKRGDEIITSGGLIAKITRVKDDADEVEAEIAQGVKVRIVKGTISGVNSKTEPAAAAQKS